MKPLWKTRQHEHAGAQPAEAAREGAQAVCAMPQTAGSELAVPAERRSPLPEPSCIDAVLIDAVLLDAERPHGNGDQRVVPWARANGSGARARERLFRWGSVAPAT